MDQKYDKLCQSLQMEQKKHPSSRQAILSYQWSSVESDTESLAQERGYQQQLQVHISSHDPSKSVLHRKDNPNRLQHDGDGSDEDASDDDAGLQFPASLAMAAQPKAKCNPNLHQQSGYCGEQTHDSDTTSQLLSDEDYSDLHYDPGWRTNLKGASHSKQNPQIYVEEYYQTKSSQGHSDEQEHVKKGGYRYTLYTSPAVVVTPHVAHSESELPHHLQSHDVPICSVTPHNHVVQHGSSETDLPSPPSIISMTGQSHNNFQRQFREECENSRDNDDLLAKDIHAMYICEVETLEGQEPSYMQGGPNHLLKISNPASTSPRVVSNKTFERLREDIVERNKITLGRNTSKGGSYVTTHRQKHSTPHNPNKVPMDMSSTGILEDRSDPELRWLQGTQDLKLIHISKGKKAQWKEKPKPLQQHTTAPGLRAEQDVCLGTSAARPVALAQPEPEKATSLQALPSTINVNINLNTTSSLLDHDAILNLASSHGCPHWIPASKAKVALFSQMCHKGTSTRLQQKLGNYPSQLQRTTALCYEGENQVGSLNEDHSEQLQQNQSWTRTTTTSSPASGSYTVLPPIGKPMTSKEQRTLPASPIPRSSSDGYLVQMEKQKQLRTGASYKAYSLKDYKQLKSDITLRGLGPNLAASEKIAEKMKRQRLYSNVIREQNKNIRRIPFRWAKDQEGDDQKVPRIKALEYARTIAKPSVQPQPKKCPKPRLEEQTEHAPYLEGLDILQPDMLQVLKKRHEKERQAVDLFRKMAGVQ